MNKITLKSLQVISIKIILIKITPSIFLIGPKRALNFYYLDKNFIQKHSKFNHVVRLKRLPIPRSEKMRAQQVKKWGFLNTYKIRRSLNFQLSRSQPTTRTHSYKIFSLPLYTFLRT